ncbi:MAG: acyl carrier protein [Polyangiaceae bacterium]|nr:acyl carrier protein [Polyangiaceae bacterium]
MDARTKEQVFEIIRGAVRIDPTALDPERDINDQVSFDSMQFVILTAAVEEKLGIELPLEVMEARTLGGFLKLVEQSMRV